MTAHPAKFSPRIIEAISTLLYEEQQTTPDRPLLVLDPFAGVGLIHNTRLYGDPPHPTTIASELEWEWAADGAKLGPTLVGDGTALPFRSGTFDAIASSPSYGNRMGDHHEARDRCKSCAGTGRVAADPEGDTSDPCKRCGGSGLSKRNTYRHQLGRPLSGNSGAALKFPGAAYEQLHADAWHEASRVLRPGGLAIINAKNFYATIGPKHDRRRVERHPVEWHLCAWLSMGYTVHKIIRVPARGNRHGENHAVRIEAELVMALRKPKPLTPTSEQTKVTGARLHPQGATP